MDTSGPFPVFHIKIDDEVKYFKYENLRKIGAKASMFPTSLYFYYDDNTRQKYEYLHLYDKIDSM